MNESMKRQLMEILECGERTAESVGKVLAKCAKGQISIVSHEKVAIAWWIGYVDEAGDEYQAFIGEGYAVEEIYRGKGREKRIYRAIL